jgi:hypothetical protein
VKLCAGGCGQPPPIAKWNNRRHGQEIEQIKMFRDALEAAGLLARERSRAT